MPTTYARGPRRGLAIVEAEVTKMNMALKRGHMWSRSSSEALHPALLEPFLKLKRMLAKAAVTDFKEKETDVQENKSGLAVGFFDPNVFLSPFLDVIRSEVFSLVFLFFLFEIIEPCFYHIGWKLENLLVSFLKLSSLLRLSRDP